jgi:hypothetical protein
VSNPVAPPPPPAGEGFPPPANQGFGGAPAAGQPYGAPPVPGQPLPGQPVPGQPVPGQPEPGQPVPGQPYGDQAQQGFGGPAAVPAEPKKKGGAGKIIGRIALALVILVVVFVGRTFVFGDKAKDAAVGDCIASSADVKVDEETDADAKVVDCASGDAAYTVVGRVEGESDVKSKSCEKFFKENEEYFVYASGTGSGYLLCLRPKA